jgi:hypothetical protein
VFLNPHRGKTPENAIKQKKSRQKLTWSFGKKLSMLFLNFPCRETPQNVLKKKVTKKKRRMVGGWV